MRWHKTEDDPPPGRFVLVLFKDGQIQCPMYYAPERKGHCWGWYPGGGRVKGSYWADMDGVPRPPALSGFPSRSD